MRHFDEKIILAGVSRNPRRDQVNSADSYDPAFGGIYIEGDLGGQDRVQSAKRDAHVMPKEKKRRFEIIHNSLKRLARLDGESSNSLFETLEDWNAQLKTIQNDLKGQIP